MSFFFEEEKSTNTLLEPKEHFYAQKEAPPEQEKLSGIESRAKGSEKYLTLDSFLQNTKAALTAFEKSNSEVAEVRNLDDAWSQITDIMIKNNVQFDNPVQDLDFYKTEFGLDGYETRHERVTRSLTLLKEEQNKNENLKLELESK